MKPRAVRLYLITNKDTRETAVVPIPEVVSDLGAHDACIYLADKYWGVPMQDIVVDELKDWKLFELEGTRN